MAIPLRVAGRLTFFAAGFHYGHIKGKRVSVKEAPLLIYAPHTSFFDVIVLFLSSIPSGVSRIENGQPILFGSMYIFIVSHLCSY